MPLQILLIKCYCFSHIQGGVNCNDLFRYYITVWVQDMQLGLLELCKAEKLGIFLNTIKRIIEVLHCRVEEILRSWASCLPVNGGENQSSFGDQMNGIKVLLRTKYKNYMQAIVAKLYSNIQFSRSMLLKRILEETQDSDGVAEVHERMQILNSQLVDSISKLYEVFTSQIFIALFRGFWEQMGQSVLRFLEGRKENRVGYKGSYYALGALDDTFASQMQHFQGNSLKDEDL